MTPEWMIDTRRATSCRRSFTILLSEWRITNESTTNSPLFWCHHHHWDFPWWRHQMETFSALLAICAGNSPIPGECPAQRPVTRSFDVFFDLRLTKRLSKQPWGWWFETLLRPLWRHRNAWCWETFSSAEILRVTWAKCVICDMAYPTYLVLIKSISWLLMPWLLASPGQQQQRYWLCEIGKFWFSLGRISATCVLLVWRNGMNCKYIFIVPRKIST